MMGVGAKRALGLYRSCAPRQVPGTCRVRAGLSFSVSLHPGEQGTGAPRYRSMCRSGGFSGPWTALWEGRVETGGTLEQQCGRSLPRNG